jgi:hypothetical protein
LAGSIAIVGGVEYCCDIYFSVSEPKVHPRASKET